MAVNMKALGIDLLSPEERLELVQQIWDSLATEADQAPLTEPQRLDLERRVAAYKADPTAGSTWEEVKDRLRKRS